MIKSVINIQTEINEAEMAVCYNLEIFLFNPFLLSGI